MKYLIDISSTDTDFTEVSSRKSTAKRIDKRINKSTSMWNSKSFNDGLRKPKHRPYKRQKCMSYD